MSWLLIVQMPFLLSLQCLVFRGTVLSLALIRFGMPVLLELGLVALRSGLSLLCLFSCFSLLFCLLSHLLIFLVLALLLLVFEIPSDVALPFFLFPASPLHLLSLKALLSKLRVAHIFKALLLLPCPFLRLLIRDSTLALSLSYVSLVWFLVAFGSCSATTILLTSLTLLLEFP